MADTSEPQQNKFDIQLAQAVEHLRGNVKWTLVAFGAIGTTLLAGSQLSNLGKFNYHDPRLWLAMFCALLALGAASYAVHSALEVTFAGYTELNDLTQEDLDYIGRNDAILEGFPSIEALQRSYRECIGRRFRHLAGESDEDETVDDEEARLALLESDKATFLWLDSLVDSVLSSIRYNRIRRQVDHSRVELTWVSIVAGIGLVGFAWAANPPSTAPSILLQSPAAPAKLLLTDAGVKALAPVLGAQCATPQPIDVIVLDITTSGSEVISLKTNKCPIRRFKLTPELGVLSGPSF